MLTEQEYSALDFARLAWRRRRFIAVPFVLGVFGTLVWSSGLPELYQSEMLIQVVPLAGARLIREVHSHTEDRRPYQRARAAGDKPNRGSTCSGRRRSYFERSEISGPTRRSRF